MLFKAQVRFELRNVTKGTVQRTDELNISTLIGSLRPGILRTDRETKINKLRSPLTATLVSPLSTMSLTHLHVAVFVPELVHPRKQRYGPVPNVPSMVGKHAFHFELRVAQPHRLGGGSSVFSVKINRRHVTDVDMCKLRFIGVLRTPSQDCLFFSAVMTNINPMINACNKTTNLIQHEEDTGTTELVTVVSHRKQASSFLSGRDNKGLGYTHRDRFDCQSLTLVRGKYHFSELVWQPSLATICRDTKEEEAAWATYEH